jgi:hypothetical protein
MEAVVIGVIVKLEHDEMDLTRLDWGYSFGAPVQNLDVHSFKYFVARGSNRVEFLAKVSKVSVSPHDAKAPWYVEFSQISDTNFIDMDLGDNRSQIVLINKEHEQKLVAILENEKSIHRPEIIPRHLSIKEAEQALRERYGLQEYGRVEISLHN